MSTRLLLARHAAHDELGRVLSGRGDGAGLSTTGHAQAERLAQRLRRAGAVALYTSPRRRARETATIIGRCAGLDVELRPELDEIDFGDWTGREFASLADNPVWRSWNEQRATSRPPGGEAMHEALSRLLRWTEKLPALHPEGTVLAVSHADVIKAALLAHLGASLDAHWRLEVSSASLSAIELWAGGGRVRFVNDTAALDGEE